MPSHLPTPIHLLPTLTHTLSFPSLLASPHPRRPPQPIAFSLRQPTVFFLLQPSACFLSFLSHPEVKRVVFYAPVKSFWAAELVWAPTPDPRARTLDLGYGAAWTERSGDGVEQRSGPREGCMAGCGHPRWGCASMRRPHRDQEAGVGDAAAHR